MDGHSGWQGERTIVTNNNSIELTTDAVMCCGPGNWSRLTVM